MLSAVLLGQTACNNLDRLKRQLRAPWRISAFPSEGPPDRLDCALNDAHALITPYWRPHMTGKTTQLRLIQALGAGVDAYDLEAVPAGCALCRVYEHALPVAEYVVGAMVALTARFVFHDQQLRQGLWVGSGRCEGEPREELAGKTMGLLGFGAIGQAVALRGAAMGLKVRAIRAHPQLDTIGSPLEWLGGPHQLRELVEESDYLVICCPLTEQTRGLLNAEMLGHLKPTAYLINVARAEIVDEEALFQVLRFQRIAGAALDVWYRYPATISEPLLPAHLPFHKLANVLMTPHLSAWTHAMIERRWLKIAANLNSLIDGGLLNDVVVAR